LRLWDRAPLRGASRAALAPTVCFFANDACGKRAQIPRNDWPETNVGASTARDAPRGRRSLVQLFQEHPPLETEGEAAAVQGQVQ